MKNVIIIIVFFILFFYNIKTEAQVYNWDLGNHPQNITTQLSGFSGTKTHTTERYFWEGSNNSIDINGLNNSNNAITVVYSTEVILRVKIFNPIGLLIGEDSLMIGNGLKKTISLTQTTATATVWMEGMVGSGFVKINHLILYDSTTTESNIHGGMVNGSTHYCLSPVLLQGNNTSNVADGTNTFAINSNLLLIAKNTTLNVNGQNRHFIFEEWPIFYDPQNNSSWDPVDAMGCIGDTLKYKVISSNIEALYFSRYQYLGFVGLYLPLPWTSAYSGSLGSGFQWFNTGQSYLDMISIKTINGNWLYRNQQKNESYDFIDKGIAITCNESSEVDLMTLNGGMSQFMYGPVSAVVYTQNFAEYVNIQSTKFNTNIIARDTLFVSYYNRATQSPHCGIGIQWMIVKDKTPLPKAKKGIVCDGNLGTAWMKVTNKPSGVITSWVKNDGTFLVGDSIAVYENSTWRAKYISPLGCSKWAEDSVFVEIPNSTIIPTVKITEEIICNVGKRITVTYSGSLETLVTIAGVSRPISADTLIMVTTTTGITVQAKNGCRETTVSRVIDPAEAFVTNQPFALSWQYSSCDTLVIKNGPRITKLILQNGFSKVLQPDETYTFEKSMQVKVERIGACLTGDSTFQAVMKIRPTKPIVKKVIIDIQKGTMKISFEPFGSGVTATLVQYTSAFFVIGPTISNEEIEIPLDSKVFIRLSNNECFIDYQIDLKNVDVEDIGLPYVNNPLDATSHGNLTDRWKVLSNQTYMVIESITIQSVDGKKIHQGNTLLEKITYPSHGIAIVNIRFKVFGIPASLSQKIVFIK